ncbi:MAG TPA: DUF3237 domain-containing protein [Stellaceae bacterium]|jgi:hypothetical protein|nr:DUF3237 domain-containing protein [Stellaceae bacterium]
MVQAPQLEFVFEARVTIGPTVEMGETPRGRQRMIPITGGTVEGPDFHATVMPGGADWQILRPDGCTELTAHYIIRTEDGTPVAVINRALRHAPPALNAKLLAGEKVDPDLVYFRGAPTFASASPAHDWLNRSVFVCTGQRWPDGVLIHFFRVL